MKKPGAGIKWEITFVISALVLSAVMSLTYFTVKAQKLALLNAMESKGTELAAMTAANAAEYLLVGYEIEAAKIMKEAANNRGVEYALVTNDKGVILAHNDMTQAGKKYEMPHVVPQVGKNPVYADAAGKKIMDFSRPVLSRGRLKLGEIHIGMSYLIIESELRRAYMKIILITLVVLVLAIIASIVIAGRLTGPIEELAKGAKIVGEGGLDYRFRLRSKNELGMLAQAFNSMTEGLKKAQEAALEKRAMEKELEIAGKIQLSLIPQKMPYLEGYEISSYYQAAKIVGGDYYDVIPLEKNVYGFIMADVSGKGVPAALVMAMASSILRAQAANTRDPRECVVNFNNELFNRMTRGMFLTVFYGILDTAKNTLDFVSAAHNETMIFRKKTGKAELLAAEGFPAGIGSGPEMLKDRLTAVRVSIETGDRIIVYTDGIFEAMNEEHKQLGMKKFVEIIENNSGKNARQLKDAVISGVSDFTKGVEQFDDMALLIIERTA